MTSPLSDSIAEHPFAYATIFKHSAGDSESNMSNASAILNDGTWLTVWIQGSEQGMPDQHLVGATSSNCGATWSTPFVIQGFNLEKLESISSGVPFVVPGSGRVYVFFFVQWNSLAPHYQRKLDNPNYRINPIVRKYPEHESGTLCFVYSDDQCATWSDRYEIELPQRDIQAIDDKVHGWLSQPPVALESGVVAMPISMYRLELMPHRRPFGVEPKLNPSESSVLIMDNLATESDPKKLSFQLRPDGDTGIRLNVASYASSSALNAVMEAYRGDATLHGFNFEDMSLVQLQDGAWLGVGRTKVGHACYVVSRDQGESWSEPETLLDSPGGEPIANSVAACPITRLSDGRFVLLSSLNDGFDHGSSHVWDSPHNRSPYYIKVGVQDATSGENAGLTFGEAVLLAATDPEADMTNPFKHGISSPQFLEHDGRYFVAYSANNNDIVLDEIPVELLDQATPTSG